MFQEIHNKPAQMFLGYNENDLPKFPSITLQKRIIYMHSQHTISI